MKPGMEVGREETIEIVVTKDMFAAFEGEIVHPVYSTVAMTYHMEWVSRKIILPFLETMKKGWGHPFNSTSCRLSTWIYSDA